MSVKIPSSFDFGLDVDLDGGVDVKLSGIPTEYGFRVRELPRIDIHLDPVELRPLDISLRLKEIPAVRAHFPVDYKLGFALFGAEIACLRLCGQAQAITEPYVPNPCELRPLTRLTPNELAAMLPAEAEPR